MPEPLLVTSTGFRPKTMALPTAGMPDLLRTASGSESDPRAAMQVRFTGQRIDRLGTTEEVDVVIPLLDLIHLRNQIQAELFSEQAKGHIRISPRDLA